MAGEECPLRCGEALVNSASSPGKAMVLRLECPRCGSFEIYFAAMAALRDLRSGERELSLLPYLACYIRQRNAEGQVRA